MSTDSNSTDEMEEGIHNLVQAFINDANTLFVECFHNLVETQQAGKVLLERVIKLNEDAKEEGNLLEEELNSHINLVRQHLSFLTEIEK